LENRLKIQIEPRWVREEGRLRGFQRETLGAIKDSSARIIKIEAPVGAGKSHIIRRLITDDFFKGKTIILTYPTRILMDVQMEASLKKEIKEVASNSPTFYSAHKRRIYVRRVSLPLKTTSL